jgi:hypothetical protein
MAMKKSRIFTGRTPTGRNVNDYLGRPPKASGTGPKNLAKTAAAATSQVRAGRPKGSVARSPRVSAARASAGYGNPPGGAGSGIPKATSPMASTPKKVVNKPKTGQPRRGMGKPRADFPSQI